jgi:hypothetical protein
MKGKKKKEMKTLDDQPQDDNVEAQAIVSTEISNTEDWPSYYTNHAEIRISPWDVRLTLGEIKTIKEGRIRVKNLATVFMSPVHAKVFSDILAEKIVQYEEKVGPIPVPPRP